MTVYPLTAGAVQKPSMVVVVVVVVVLVVVVVGPHPSLADHVRFIPRVVCPLYLTENCMKKKGDCKESGAFEGIGMLNL